MKTETVTEYLLNIKQNIAIVHEPHLVVFEDKISQCIEENYGRHDFKLVDCGIIMGMSKSTFQRYIKRVFGSTPSIVLRRYRIHAAADLFEQTQLSVSDIAHAVGYTHMSYFTKCFKKEFNIAPNNFRKWKSIKRATHRL